MTIFNFKLFITICNRSKFLSLLPASKNDPVRYDLQSYTKHAIQPLAVAFFMAAKGGDNVYAYQCNWLQSRVEFFLHEHCHPDRSEAEWRDQCNVTRLISTEFAEGEKRVEKSEHV